MNLTFEMIAAVICARFVVSLVSLTGMIPALHEHSTLSHLFGQTAIFAFGIGFMQSMIILEYFLFN